MNVIVTEPYKVETKEVRDIGTRLTNLICWIKQGDYFLLPLHKWR